MTVAVNRLITDRQTVSDKSNMIQIYNPDPRAFSLHRSARRTVPLYLFPVFICLPDSQSFHRSIQIAVSHITLIALGIVKIIQKRAPRSDTDNRSHSGWRIPIPSSPASENMRFEISSQLVPSTSILIPISLTCSAAAMAIAWRTGSSAG